MIRNTFRKALIGAISGHAFLREDDFEFSESAVSDEGAEIRITYRYAPQYLFTFRFPTRWARSGISAWDGYVYHCAMSPGEETIQETVQANDRSELIGEVGAWVSRIYEELLSAPESSSIAEIRAALDALRDRATVSPEEPILESEAKRYREILDAFRSEVEDKFRAEAATNEDLSAKLESLSRDIEFLKASIGSMPKLSWWELAQARFIRWNHWLPLKELAVGAKLVSLLAGDASPVVKQVAEGVEVVALLGADQSKSQKNGNP